jgi:SAM-dependent methyltransferase
MNNEAKQPASAQASSSDAWADFWSGTHSIYVNALHMRVHYERIAADLAQLIAARRARSGTPLVLDWGCGDALNAPALVGFCRELWLYDGVGAVRSRIAARFAGASGIRVLSDSDWQTLAPGGLDMIIVVSVAQYLSRADLENLMARFRSVLKPDGEVIFADIIPPHVSMVADIASLLGSALANGFFIAACIGLAKTFFSEYRRLRATAGFSCYEADDFLQMLTRHGFAAERLAQNVGFNQQRMTFRAVPKV